MGHENLLTKQQVISLFKEWGVSEPVPRKGQCVHVCFAGKALDRAKVSWTNLRGTYGGRLYGLVMQSRDEAVELSLMPKG